MRHDAWYVAYFSEISGAYNSNLEFFLVVHENRYLFEKDAIQMIFEKTSIEGVHLVKLDRNEDPRGYFARAFCESEFECAGIVFRALQANISRSLGKGTIRGMHYRDEGMHEAKFVRCIRGAVWDVVVDMREDSPTKRMSLAFLLSDENGHALYIPDGVAHGHQTLTDMAELLYLMDEAYQSQHQKGLRWDDPAIGIKWPLPVGTISQRDLTWPLLV